MRMRFNSPSAFNAVMQSIPVIAEMIRLRLRPASHSRPPFLAVTLRTDPPCRASPAKAADLTLQLQTAVRRLAHLPQLDAFQQRPGARQRPEHRHPRSHDGPKVLLPPTR